MPNRLARAVGAAEKEGGEQSSQNRRTTKLTETNVRDMLGAKWAWKMARLFQHVRFAVGPWQAEGVRAVIEEHNQAVQRRWLANGGDPARACWCAVAELTLDHLRPSPAWKQQ